MKKIGVFTVFDSIDPQYSIANLTIDQLKLLLKYNYKPTLFVVEGFKDFDAIPKGVEVKTVVPRLILTDYQLNIPKKPNFDHQVDVLTSILSEYFKEYNVIITQDVVFQTWFLPHNQAIRNIAEKHPHIKWLHWMHSAPTIRPKNLKYPHTLRFSGIPNSIYVAMNRTDIELYAQQYNVPTGNVRVVYNCRDIYKFFDMHPFSIKLIEKYKLLDTDVLVIYPTRMTSGKNPDIAIHLVAKINETKNAKIVFCNSYSNAKEEKDYMELLRRQAEGWGLPRDHLIFTSEEDKKWELGVPSKVVRDLMWISNLFFLPSKSEGCSLILLEAALTKNLIVLNKTLPSLKEFGEADALYIDCPSIRAGKLTNVQYHPNRDAHLKEWAGIIINHLEQDRSLNMFRRIRQKFNPDWIMRNQLEPLLQ